MADIIKLATAGTDEKSDAVVTVADRGALDCVLRARVETALLRGMEEA